MLDVVTREHRIDRSRRHRRHVGHGAGDVGLHGRVDVEPDLGPVRGVEAGGGAVLALGAAADVEQGGHDLCLKKNRHRGPR